MRRLRGVSVLPQVQDRERHKHSPHRCLGYPAGVRLTQGMNSNFRRVGVRKVRHSHHHTATLSFKPLKAVPVHQHTSHNVSCCCHCSVAAATVVAVSAAAAAAASISAIRASHIPCTITQKIATAVGAAVEGPVQLCLPLLLVVPGHEL